MDNNLQKSSANGEVLLKYFYDYNEKKEKIDIVKLANFFGFVVEEETLSDEVHSQMIVYESKRILVNSFLETESKRYAIAYELAYYFLHYRGERKIFKHKLELVTQDYDEKVKDLAVSLLVKEDDFCNCYSLIKEQYNEEKIIEILKEEFLIPTSIIKAKLQEIKKQTPVMVKSKI